MRGRTLRNFITNYFNKHNNVAYNNEIGPIILNNASAKSDIAHGTSKLKLSTIYAIIPTLENGEIIETSSKELSGKKNDSALIVAPIKVDGSLTINGDERAYLIARVLQDKQSTRFYLHDVNVGVLNKKGELTTIPDSNGAPGDVNASINNIPNSNEDVKQYSL